jgi:hypothetical protein
MSIAEMLFLLLVAVGLWLWRLDYVNDKRAAEQAAVRRRYPRSPWISPDAHERPDEPYDATEETGEILELEASGGFRVPKTSRNHWRPKD